MKEELLKILNMVKDGSIEVEEAAELIEAFYDNPQPKSTNQNPRKKLVIKVNSSDGDKVNVKIPMGLIKIAKVMIPLALAKEGKMKDEEINQIMQFINNIDFDQFEGEELINVDSADGDVVKIYIE
ncbi:hypothetical protein XO10_10080 [Marinitoga sp. 1135]|uniref:SHOCT-like domain-containing protein n=1 Tax=unclassified Marinitoga TaxID=2640159 RepID=UPI000950A704|nr:MULTISPECIES: hypothetical protein [unclassified Marinitoga]APT76809.1 hypothetical protein LN42_10805 [Marinitoga sp. 1137]NUU96577.1 hypothetical protein [Marinitoga sp. 1135]